MGVGWGGGVLFDLGMLSSIKKRGRSLSERLGGFEQIERSPVLRWEVRASIQQTPLLTPEKAIIV